jgi:glutathione S-transferase
MIAYLHYPKDEHGFDFAASHPAIRNWLDRVAALDGWRSAYELLPGTRLKKFRQQ